MKEFILGLIKKLANILLVVSIVSAGAGLALTLIPGLTEDLGVYVSAENLALITGTLSMAAGAGGVAKYSSTALKKVTQLSRTDTELKLRRQEEKHNAEIDEIKNQHAQELEVFTSTINVLVDNTKNTQNQQDKILQVLAITAKRNITSNLTSAEDKSLYKEFLTTLPDDKPADLKNVYTTINHIVEEQVKPEVKEEEEKDIITQRLERM